MWNSQKSGTKMIAIVHTTIESHWRINKGECDLAHQNQFSNHKQKKFIHAIFWCLKIGFLSNLKHN
jgi:hypothetical protein